MPSPADATVPRATTPTTARATQVSLGRRAGEWTLRAIAVAALALLLWRWTRPAVSGAAVADVIDARADSGRTRRLDGASQDAAQDAVQDALGRWTSAPVAAAHVVFGAPPTEPTRSWLRALAGAGMSIGWSAPSAVAVAISASSVVDPAGGVRVDVAAPSGSAVAVGDALALSDTARVTGARRDSAGVGRSLVLPAAADTVLARAGATTARVPLPAPLRFRHVLVVGRAGWEGKFVAAALEERGWPVHVQLAVLPRLDVTGQGGAATTGLAPDTATTAAVIVVDSGVVDAASAARLARYVRDGGGVVLGHDAATEPTLRALVAGSFGTTIAGRLGALDTDAPLNGLALTPIVPRPDAVVLERRPGGAAAAVVARRVGAGRVAQIGYAETWRWRMAAPDDAPAAHRAWWARVVGAVAYAPASAVPNAATVAAGDPAPLAATVAALGTPRARPTGESSRGPGRSWPPDGVLAVVAGAAMLGEVGSRRVRGER